MFLWFGRKKKKEDKNPVEVLETEPKENKPENATSVSEEATVSDTANNPPTEEKTASEKVETKPASPRKPSSKKEAPVSDDKKKTSEIAEDSEEAKKSYGRVYHISKRSSDGRWQVKFGGSDKVIKTFDTQANAIAYTKELSERQGHGYIIHKTDGKIRKLKY